ncbi:MAG: redox-regulated molecular chaperone Hsp33, partial [Streptococcus sp.]
MIPQKQQTHGSPFEHFYAKIVAMDKIIKTISESGAFRAFVLDSTETV